MRVVKALARSGRLSVTRSTEESGSVTWMVSNGPSRAASGMGLVSSDARVGL